MAILIICPGECENMSLLQNMCQMVLKETGTQDTLSSQFLAFDSPNPIFDHENVTDVDVFSFQPEGVFLEIVPDSRLHVHNFGEYIDQHPVIFSKNVPKEEFHQEFVERFTKILYFEKFDIRSQIIVDASQMNADISSYIHFNYVKTIHAWSMGLLTSLMSYPEGLKFCGFIWQNFLDSPELSLHKFARCTHSPIDNSSLQKFANTYAKTPAEANSTEQWKHCYSTTQKLSMWFIFGEVFHLFSHNRIYRGRFVNLSPAKMSGMVTRIEKRMRVYSRVINLSLVKALLK